MTVNVLIRAAEGCAPDPFLLWDSRWSPLDGAADWRMAARDESHNRGGMAAHAALATSVTLALFTDKRCPLDHPLAFLADGDPRGWWGDGVDVRADAGEVELGSLLWLFERAPLSFRGDSMTRWVEAIARDALLPLIAQGAVVRIDAQASANEIANRLELLIQLYGRDGAAKFNQKFELIWNQVAR